MLTRLKSPGQWVRFKPSWSSEPGTFFQHCGTGRTVSFSMDASPYNMKSTKLVMQAASLLVACAAAMPGIAQTEDTHPPLYMDSTQPVEKRVEDLLAKMTLDEKLNYIGGT